MENGPKQDIQSPENISAEQNQELQESIKRQADVILERYKDVVSKEDFLKQDFNPKKIQRGSFNDAVSHCITECERLCRAAIGMKADNIIVLDKGGRPYGYMFLAVLKMVILEYAKLNNISPENVKVPQIKYVNPPPSMIISKFSNGLVDEEVEYLQKLVEVNSINVVFDESSNHNREGFGLKEVDSIESQYKNKTTDPTSKQVLDMIGGTTAWSSSDMIARTTKSTVYPFIGYGGGIGGIFREIYDSSYMTGNPEQVVSDKKLKNFKYEEIKNGLIDKLINIVEKANVSTKGSILEHLPVLMKNDVPMSPFTNDDVARHKVTEMLKLLLNNSDADEVSKIIDEHNRIISVRSRIAEDNQSWISGVNNELSSEYRNRFYGLARTISAFAIRDIYEKSFDISKKPN